MAMSSEVIARRILLVRGQKTLLDAYLAVLYGVSTKRLNQQVKRNLARFPADFLFQLTRPERDEVVANCDHLSKLRFSSSMPYAFTEHGALMAASVLNTRRAVEMSIYVVRAFVGLREALGTHSKLERRLIELERKCDRHFKVVFDAIRELMRPPEPAQRRRIGFVRDD